MIYEKVKDLCDEHRISIWQLEQSCEIANGTIGKWRIHGKSPRVSTLQKIAKYFSVPLDFFL